MIFKIKECRNDLARKPANEATNPSFVSSKASPNSSSSIPLKEDEK